jgi:hypothetical protein
MDTLVPHAAIAAIPTPQCMADQHPINTRASHAQAVILACAGVKVYGLTYDKHGVIDAQGGSSGGTEIGGATAAGDDPDEGRCAAATCVLHIAYDTYSPTHRLPQPSLPIVCRPAHH